MFSNLAITRHSLAVSPTKLNKGDTGSTIINSIEYSEYYIGGSLAIYAAVCEKWQAVPSSFKLNFFCRILELPTHI